MSWRLTPEPQTARLPASKTDSEAQLLSATSSYTHADAAAQLVLAPPPLSGDQAAACHCLPETGTQLSNTAAWDAQDWVWDAATFTAVPKAAPPADRLDRASSTQHTWSWQAPAPHQAADSPCSFSMDPPNLNNLAEAAGKANEAGVAMEEHATGAAFEQGERKVSRRKRIMRVTTARASDESPEGSGDNASEKSGSGGAWQAPQPRPGVPICQVEDCGRELSGLTTYHQRCRICEVHIKLPSFMRHGTQQRFCQQCGRCHQLSAFDSGKRSCRAQLQKHNARRRKLANKKSQNSSADDSPKNARSGAGGDADGDDSPHARRPARRQKTFEPSAAAEQHQQQQQQQHLAALGAAAQKPTLSTLGVGLQQSQADFLRSLAPAYVHDLAAASKPFGAVPSQDYQTAYGFGGADAYGRQDWLAGRLPGSSALTAETLSKAYSNTPQFGRLAEDVMQQQQQQQQQQQHPLARAALEQSTFQAFGGDPTSAAAAWAAHSRGFDGGANAGLGASSSYDRAVSLLAQQGAAASAGAVADYFPQNLMLRLSVKLFDCTPAQLPSDLRDQLIGWLQAAPTGVEGYMRPGCVHVTLQAMMEASTIATDGGGHNLRNAIKHLLERDPGTWADRLLVMQLLGEAAVVKGSKVTHHWTAQQLAAAGGPGSSSGSDAAPVMPHILRIDPVAIAGAASQVLIVLGHNITGDDVTVLARADGRYIDSKVLSTDTEMAAAAAVAGVEVVRLRLPDGVSAGLLHVEIQRGTFLGEAHPVAVLPGSAARAAVAATAEALPAGQRTGFLTDVGIVAAAAGLGATPNPACLSIHAALATARRLLAYACKCGLWALAAFVLPVAQRGVDGVPGLLAACEASGSAGWPLLHLAVASGSQRTVDVLLEWGQQQGHVWDGGAPGPLGLTPLHLAAALPDGGAIALALTHHTAPGASAWFSSETEDGQKPAHFAARASGGGSEGLHAAMMRALAQAGDPATPIFTGAFAADELTSGSSPSATGRGSSCDTLTRRSDAKLLGGSASCISACPPSLAALAAAMSRCCSPPPPAAAAVGPPQQHSPQLVGGFSLAEPADSAAYRSHTAPADVTQLWAQRPAAVPSPLVRLVPVEKPAVAPKFCGSQALHTVVAPSPLVGVVAADGDLAAEAQALITHALKASRLSPDNQGLRPMTSCRQDAGWGLLGGRKGLLFASFGALCAAVIEALPMVL